jgi:hypothetical protein
MAYELHIESDSPIEIEEWLKIVEKTNGVRFNDDDQVVVNPITKEEIRVKAESGSAETYLESTDSWQRFYRYNHRRISFKTTVEWDIEECGIRNYTFVLASKLKAKVVGDEGEIYSAKIETEPLKKSWWKLW